jgi:hypothetical protein
MAESAVASGLVSVAAERLEIGLEEFLAGEARHSLDYGIA